MNHAGEITPLAQLVRPHVALITTIAPAHLEFFGIARSDRRRQGGDLRGPRARRRGAAQPRQSPVRAAAAARAPRPRASRASSTFGEHAEADARLLRCVAAGRSRRPSRPTSSAQPSTTSSARPAAIWRSTALGALAAVGAGRRRSRRWPRPRSPHLAPLEGPRRARELAAPGGSVAADRRELQRQSGLDGARRWRCSARRRSASGPPHRRARRHAGAGRRRRRPSRRPGRAASQPPMSIWSSPPARR